MSKITSKIVDIQVQDAFKTMFGAVGTTFLFEGKDYAITTAKFARENKQVNTPNGRRNFEFITVTTEIQREVK